MTETEMESLAEAVGAAIAEHTAPLKKRIAELERRVEAAETRGLEFRGTWQKAEASYRRGSVTIFNSSIWIACRDTEGERPGTGDTWQLALKGPGDRDKGVMA